MNECILTSLRANLFTRWAKKLTDMQIDLVDKVDAQVSNSNKAKKLE